MLPMKYQTSLQFWLFSFFFLRKITNTRKCSFSYAENSLIFLLINWIAMDISPFTKAMTGPWNELLPHVDRAVQPDTGSYDWAEMNCTRLFPFTTAIFNASYESLPCHSTPNIRRKVMPSLHTVNWKSHQIKGDNSVI